METSEIAQQNKRSRNCVAIQDEKNKHTILGQSSMGYLAHIHVCIPYHPMRKRQVSCLSVHDVVRRDDSLRKVSKALDGDCL